MKSWPKWSQPCGSQARAGKLTYEINIKPASKGEIIALNVRDDIRAKIPTPERPENIFFATEGNVLQRTDPRQKEFQLRAVAAPAQPLRSVVESSAGQESAPRAVNQ